MIKNVSSEILVLIFKNLETHQLKDIISLVCKRWYKLIYDFRLLQFNLRLEEDFEIESEELLKDLIMYPTFGPRIKAFLFKYDWDCDTRDFATILERCPNVEKFNILVQERSNFLESISPQLFSLEKPLLTKLKILGLDYAELKRYRVKREEKYIQIVDLSKLLNQMMPNLQKVVVNASIRYPQKFQLSFVKNEARANVNQFLHTIHIVSPYNTMTRDCLEYITSGNFTKLTNLNLLVKLAEDEGRDSQSSMEELKKDPIWLRLKEFCSTSVKNYNICFRATNGAHLFSIDNCETIIDRHDEVNEFDFCAYDPFEFEEEEDEESLSFVDHDEEVYTYQDYLDFREDILRELREDKSYPYFRMY